MSVLQHNSISARLIALLNRGLAVFGFQVPGPDDDAVRVVARLNAMLNSVSDGVVMFDRDWRFVYINDVSERWNRIPREKLLGRSVWETFPDSLSRAFYREYHRAVEENTNVVFEEFLRGRWLEVRAFPSEEGLTVYFRDVTKRREAVAALQESNARFQLLTRATSEVVWDWDIKKNTLWWSEGLQKVFGWSPEEMQPSLDSWTEYIHPDDREAMSASFLSAMASGAETWEKEYRFRRRDGSYAIAHDRGCFIRDDNGEAIRAVGTLADITVRKEAERRLRDQASMLNEANDAIVARDLDYRVCFWNKGAERLYGWSANEVMGNNDPHLLYRDGSIPRKAMQEVLSNGEWIGELHQVARDGRDIVVQAHLTLLRDEHGAPTSVLAISTNITDRLQMEKRLRQSQKLEAIGQLTGGIAHDFNNLLTVIAGNADMLAEALADRDDLQPLAEMTRMAAERGADLTKHLLAFARRQPLEPKVVNVADLIAEMDGLVRRTLGEHIELKVIRGSELGSALIDTSQLESAILNLAINARDAMPGGGTLTVELANVELDESFAAEEEEEIQPGPYVMIAVSDTGTGMTPDVLAHAFEPFFTTKEVGRGTGLGLSMVYGFAKQSGGHAKIYSELGHGTTVKLYLPRATQPATRQAQDDKPAAVKGAERILLVEDDDLVRKYVAAQLSSLGYEVTTACNGPEALDILRQGASFDLLFTDMVMPGGLNGQQLADVVHQMRPAMPVLFTSGYTEHASIHTGRLKLGMHLLTKPYRRQDLAAKIRLVLDQRG